MIYVLKTEDGRFFKVGVAKDPAKRRSELLTGSPQHPMFAALGDGGRAEESAIHAQLRGYGSGGGSEWFMNDDAGEAFGIVLGSLRLAALPESTHKEIRRLAALYQLLKFDGGGCLQECYYECLIEKDDGGRDGYCGNSEWYGHRSHGHGIKRRMSEVIGFGAPKDSPLYGHEAYSAAYEALYRLLPPCRPGPNCGCV
jgi:hypothetical protein